MQPSYIGIIGLIILEGSMDIPVDCHIHNPPLGIRNPSQAAQHKALLQCRDLVIMKELTGAIFVGLGGFFVGALRIQGFVLRKGLLSTILFWGSDLDHQSYENREGSGFFGVDLVGGLTKMKEKLCILGTWSFLEVNRFNILQCLYNSYLYHT